MARLKLKIERGMTRLKHGKGLCADSPNGVLQELVSSVNHTDSPAVKRRKVSLFSYMKLYLM